MTEFSTRPFIIQPIQYNT